MQHSRPCLLTGFLQHSKLVLCIVSSAHTPHHQGVECLELINNICNKYVNTFSCKNKDRLHIKLKLFLDHLPLSPRGPPFGGVSSSFSCVFKKKWMVLFCILCSGSCFSHPQCTAVSSCQMELSPSFFNSFRVSQGVMVATAHLAISLLMDPFKNLFYLKKLYRHTAKIVKGLSMKIVFLPPNQSCGAAGVLCAGPGPVAVCFFTEP